MGNRRDRLIFISHFLSRRKIYTLINFDSKIERIYTFTPTEISQHLHLSPKKSTQFYHYLHNDSLYKKIHELLRPYEVVTMFDKNYPIHLKELPDAPVVLYCLGDLSLFCKEKVISIVGTRKPSTYAFQKLSRIMYPLLAEKWVIVSGMAYGVDSYAHEIALHQAGKTITVLGSGFDHIYPKANEAMFHQIVKNGLAVSEYPPYVKPKKHHFPERNRIVSGLSVATLVVEAKERSGTFITVDQALEQGKEVYAIPDSPLIEEAIGCLTLIEQGAKLVKNAMDIIEDWQHIKEKN